MLSSQDNQGLIKSKRQHAIPAFIAEHSVVLVFFIVLVLGHLVLLWTNRLLPFVDLPDHLATATILKYIDESPFKDYYEAGSFRFKPNIAHILFCAGNLFSDVETANRIYYSVYVILLPLSMLLLIMRMGGNPAFSLASFPLMYSLSVCWGFAGFTMSIPLLIFMLSLISIFLEQQTLKNAIVLAIGFPVLFCFHALMTVFAISLYVLIVTIRSKLSRETLKTLLVLGPVLLMIGIWWWTREVSPAGQGFFQPLLNYYACEFFPTLLNRTRLIILENYALYPGIKGYLVGILFFILICCYAVYHTVLYGMKSLLEVVTEKNSIVVVFTVWSLVCFLFLPDQIFNFQILYPRFSVMFLLGIIAWSSLLLPKRIANKVAIFYFMVAILHFYLWWGYFAEFNSENKGFTRGFFPDDAAGKTLAAIVYDFSFRGKPVYIHMPSYYIVWLKSPGTFRIVDFVDFAPPLRRKSNGLHIPAYKEWEWTISTNPSSYNSADFLLIRSYAKQWPHEYIDYFQSENSSGPWRLMRNSRQQTN